MTDRKPTGCKRLFKTIIPGKNHQHQSQRYMTNWEKYCNFVKVLIPLLNKEGAQLIRKRLISKNNKQKKSQFIQKEIHKKRWFTLFIKKNAQ